MKKLLTIALILCSVTGFAQMRGGSQFDPGAARANLNNVDAAATPSMTSITLSDKVRAAWADILGDIYASGTVKVSTGTAAAPAYSFASDPNTGMYSPVADTLEFAVAGVPVATISSAGITGIANGSVTNAKLAEPVAIEKGGTGATTAAEALAALGGASLNGSSTVAFNASTINGVAPLTAAEKTQALVGSSTVDVARRDVVTRLGSTGWPYLRIPFLKNSSPSVAVPLASFVLGNYGLISGKIVVVTPFGSVTNDFSTRRTTAAQTIATGTPVIVGTDISGDIVFSASSDTGFVVSLRAGATQEAYQGYMELSSYAGISYTK